MGKNEEEGKERKTEREKGGKEREINKLIDFRA